MTYLDPQDIPEKWPDMIEMSVTYRGVQLGSRYRKRAEIGAMMAMVDFVQSMISAPIDHWIKEVYCDSKACATYSVKMGGDTNPEILSQYCGYGFILHSGGHNGVDVTTEDGSYTATCDPYWEGEEGYFINVLDL